MERPILPGLRLTFLVHIVVGLIFGLGQLLIPETFLGLVGWKVTDPGAYRMIGAAVLAFTASSWWAYRETAWERVKIIVEAEVVWTTLAALVQLAGVLFGGLAAAAWITVIVMAGFAAAFGYFYFQQTSVALKPARR